MVAGPNDLVSALQAFNHSTGEMGMLLFLIQELQLQHTLEQLSSRSSRGSVKTSTIFMLAPPDAAFSELGLDLPQAELAKLLAQNDELRSKLNATVLNHVLLPGPEVPWPLDYYADSNVSTLLG